jgi:hypothetical protein
MTLAEMLGARGLNLFTLPGDALDGLVARRARGRALDRAYAAAAAAEAGMFVQGPLGRLDWPLQVMETIAQFVEYNADCYDYSCPDVQDPWNIRRDLCLFSGHYGKLERILGPSPGDVLAADPGEAYRRLENSPWALVPKDHDPDGIAKKVAVLLWHVKARIILGRGDDEDALARDLGAASDLLRLPTFDVA